MNAMLKTMGVLTAMLIGGVLGWYAAKHQSPPEELADQDYIATVNGKGIDKDWFIEQMKMRGGYKPGQFQSTEQKEALLDFLINEEIMFQQAVAQGVHQDAAVSQLYKKAVIDKFITDGLNQKLQSVKVGNSEVEAHFYNNQTAYNKPARRRAAIIMTEVTDADDENSRNEIRQRVEQALQAVNDLPSDTTHFGELAKVYSDDRASMYQGGVIGWLINHPSRSYKWDRSVIDALFSLENPGDVSGVIEAEDGYYIVRLVAAENVKEKSLEQLRKGIKNQLLQAKRKQMKDEFMASLIDGADISIDHNKLAAIQSFSPSANDQDKTPPALPTMGGAQ